MPRSASLNLRGDEVFQKAAQNPFRKLIVAHLLGDCPEFFEGYVGPQATLNLRQRIQSFIGCHHLFIGISFLDLASMVNNGNREETGAMEVDIRVYS